MKKKQIEIINKIDEYIKDIYQDFDPGHDYLHILRVATIARRINRVVKGDLYLVLLVSYLHDVEDDKFDSSIKVIDILNRFNVEEDYKNKVLNIIPYLSFHKYPRLGDDFPIEGKVVSDADRIDALGAIGVARAFSYGGYKHRPLYGSDDSSIKHFDDKLLRLGDYLYFDVSKRIASRRIKFLKRFYDEFKKEVG